MSDPFELASLGNFDAAEHALTNLPANRLSRLRLDLLRELAGAANTRVEADELHAHVVGNEGVEALATFGRRAVLEGDVTSLKWALERQQSLGVDDTNLAWRTTRLWWQLATGAPDVDDAVSAEALAVQKRDASRVVETATLRAWFLLEHEDEAATKMVRRASRMASTESRPQEEYLAHTLLARLRRTELRPHLALRIVRSLQEVAPPIWTQWLAWESELAGNNANLGVVAIAQASHQRTAFDQARNALAMSFAPWREDVDALVGALDLHAEANDAVQAWRRGTRPHPPRGVHSVCLALPDEDSTLAYVLAPAKGPAGRVLRPGLRLVDVDALHQLKQSQRKRGRVETAAAALALHPKGMAEDELFSAVYGFDHEEGVHDGVLDLVLHRLRKELGEDGSVTRTASRVSMTHRGLLIPDPRCSLPVDNRVLAELARKRASANELAAALELPLRTVQRVLKRLAMDGACLKEREGRAVVYRVEDTTFSEPTHH